MVIPRALPKTDAIFSVFDTCMLLPRYSKESLLDEAMGFIHEIRISRLVVQLYYDYGSNWARTVYPWLSIWGDEHHRSH